MSKTPSYKHGRFSRYNNADIIKDEFPDIFGRSAADLNDSADGKEFTHEQVGLLLLFAIESGEYKNI